MGGFIFSKVETLSDSESRWILIFSFQIPL